MCFIQNTNILLYHFISRRQYYSHRDSNQAYIIFQRLFINLFSFKPIKIIVIYRRLSIYHLYLLLQVILTRNRTSKISTKEQQEQM